jgi:flagellin-like protein
MNKQKKGVSPIIATVLLISIVVVLGLIIFLWFRGITEEAVTKFGGTNINLVCADVSFEASYSAGTLVISNIGNVPIYDMKVEITKEGEYETKDISSISSWPGSGLNPGAIFSEDIGSEIGSDVEGLKLTPVLIGESDKGEKTVMCEKEYAYNIPLN